MITGLLPYGLTIAVLLGLIIAFLLEVRPAGLVASIGLAVLLIGGVLSPDEGLSGLSSAATVTVGAMFVLSAGIQESGLLRGIGARLSDEFGRRPVRGLLLLCLGVAAMSAFVNNTAVVAILLPTVIQATRGSRLSASQVLMPLSFASMLGGVCTLLGTSTNLVASSMAEEAGLSPIGMFELAPAGLVMLAAGLLYLLVLHPFIPRRRSGDNDDLSARYVTTVRLGHNSPWIGRSTADWAKHGTEEAIEILGRGGEDKPDEAPLAAGDSVHLRTDLRTLSRLVAADWLSLPGDSDRSSEEGSPKRVLVEVIVPANSPLADRRVGATEFREQLSASLLAIRRQGHLEHDHLGSVRLQAGDVLVLLVDAERASSLESRDEVVVLSRIEQTTRGIRRWIPAVIIAGVVTAASTGLVPVVVAALAGAILVVASGSVRQDRAIRAIDWNVMLLLAALLPLGTALAKTGIAADVARLAVYAGDWFGVHGVVGAFFLISAVLTSFISNNGTAAILVPIAVSSGAATGMDPRPFVMAVTFGASTCFLTPIGYQTNTLIYGAGQFRFGDFLKYGTPITLITAAIATALIPVVWG